MSRASKLLIDFGEDLKNLPFSANSKYNAVYQGHRVQIFPTKLTPGYVPVIARFTQAQAREGFTAQQWDTIHRRIEKCTRGRPLPPITQKPSKHPNLSDSTPPSCRTKAPRERNGEAW